MCYSMAEIEEQELREAKRACNFIWAAAENYELEHFSLHLHRTERQICI